MIRRVGNFHLGKLGVLGLLKPGKRSSNFETSKTFLLLALVARSLLTSSVSKRTSFLSRALMMTRLTVSSVYRIPVITLQSGEYHSTFELVCGVLNTTSRAGYQRLLGFCRPTIVIIIASSSRAAQAAAGRKKLARSAMTKRRVGRIASAAWRRNMYSRPSAAGATALPASGAAPLLCRPRCP